MQSMLQASFTSDLVLYAASGLLTYGANDGMFLRTLLLRCSQQTVVSPPDVMYSLELRTAVQQQQGHCLMLYDMSGINPN